MCRGEMIRRHIGKRYVKTEADIRVMLPQAMECLGLPEVRRSKEVSVPRAFGGNMALRTP